MLMSLLLEAADESSTVACQLTELLDDEDEDEDDEDDDDGAGETVLAAEGCVEGLALLAAVCGLSRALLLPALATAFACAASVPAEVSCSLSLSPPLVLSFVCFGSRISSCFKTPRLRGLAAALAFLVPAELLLLLEKDVCCESWLISDDKDSTVRERRAVGVSSPSPSPCPSPPLVLLPFKPLSSMPPSARGASRSRPVIC